jgi:flagellar assembly protein FliH
MSINARLVRSDAPTDRFHWQRRGGDAPLQPVVAVLPVSGGGATSALRDLPSPTADRLAAAEREAFARGYGEGRADALAATEAASTELMARLTAAIQEIGLLRPALIRRAEREAVQLAIALAARLSHRIIREDPSALVLMARHALEQLGRAQVATVHLHPDDYAIVASGLGLTPDSGIGLAADPALPRGGCVVHSEFGTIDVGIDAQIRELSRALLESSSDAEEAADESCPR